MFPAITKPYSQVTPASSPSKDRPSPSAVSQDVKGAPPNPPFRQNNRASALSSQSRPQSLAPPRYTSRPSERTQNRKFLRVPQAFPQESIPRRGLLKSSSLKPPPDNGSDPRRSITSIQNVRKYSVVDPSTLKFVEGRCVYIL